MERPPYWKCRCRREMTHNSASYLRRVDAALDLHLYGDEQTCSLEASSVRPVGAGAQPREKVLTRARRVAFVGNSLPRRCGIATFTTHLQQAIDSTGATSSTSVVAMTDEGRQYDYPSV